MPKRGHTLPTRMMDVIVRTVTQTNPNVSDEDDSQTHKLREVLFEHARLMWDAECENASRYASRVQLAAGAAIALMGLGFFGITWTYQIPSEPMCAPWATIVLHGALTVLIVLLGTAFGILLTRRSRDTGNASDHLGLFSDDLTTVEGGQTLLLKKVLKAHADLKRRNARERLRLRKGTTVLQVAIGLLFLIVLFYLWVSLPAKLRPLREVSHGNAERTGEATGQ